MENELTGSLSPLLLLHYTGWVTLHHNILTGELQTLCKSVPAFNGNSSLGILDEESIGISADCLGASAKMTCSSSCCNCF